MKTERYTMLLILKISKPFKEINVCVCVWGGAIDSVLTSHPDGPGFDSRRSRQKFILSMSLRLINSSTAGIKWTVPKLNNVDRTHLAQLDSATEKRDLCDLFSFPERAAPKSSLDGVGVCPDKSVRPCCKWLLLQATFLFQLRLKVSTFKFQSTKKFLQFFPRNKIFSVKISLFSCVAFFWLEAASFCFVLKYLDAKVCCSVHF